MADQSEKADALVAQAKKKLASWFASFSGNKYEDAAELLTKAANLYKASKKWDEAGATFEEVARCHTTLKSAHEAATAYTDAASCYKKTNAQQAVLLYKEAVAIQIDLGRFSTAAKLQKEIGELMETEGDLQAAMEAYQTAADYYAGEESHSSANQCLLKVAGHATTAKDYKKAIEIYEQVAMQSVESTLLKWSVKGYLLSAGLCHLANGELPAIQKAIDKYEQLDVTFGTTREGGLLRSLAVAFEQMDVDDFTDKVREYDEISRLDPQKTTLLLEAKNKIKESQEDIT